MGCDARALLSATNTGRLTRAYETPVGRCRKVHQQYLADQKHLLASDEALVGLPWQALTDRGHSKVPFCIHSATTALISGALRQYMLAVPAKFLVLLMY